MFSKNRATALLGILIALLIPAAMWLEKNEPKLWQERLYLPSFTSEENRHTPLEPIGTYLPPVITANRTFTPQENPILIAGNVEIPAGVTVRFEAGTHVLVHEYGSLTVQGTLLIAGTAAELITFTTNEAHVANRTWSGIVVSEGGQATIDHTRIRHASPAVTCEAAATVLVRNTVIELGNVGVFTESNQCQLMNSVIQHVTDGIISVGVKPQLFNTTIQSRHEDVRSF